MDTNLAKSLTELIDETLEELEDLRKSRFDAEEIDMGSDANGDMKMKKKDEDDEDESDDEDEDDEQDRKSRASKSDDEDEDDEDESDDEDEDDEQDRKAPVKKSDDEDEDDEDEDDDEKMKKAEMECAKAEMECAKAESKRKKAVKKRNALAEKISMKKGDSWSPMKKSKVTSKVEKLEKTFKAKIAEMTEAINRIADQPVYARGSTYRDIQPLAKSSGDMEPLSKTKILGELVSLKKSGKDVSTDDVLRVELGGQGDLQEIANKYSIR